MNYNMLLENPDGIGLQGKIGIDKVFYLVYFISHKKTNVRPEMTNI